MEITKDIVNEVNAKIKVHLTPSDYQSKVEKTLRDYQKKTNMPGFRVGHAPLSVIKKMYGKSVLINEVMKVVNDSLGQYISSNKISIFGQPLPAEDETLNFDVDNPQDATFVFDIGLIPQFELDIEAVEPIDYFNVSATQTEIDNYTTSILKKHGNFEEKEISDVEDILHVHLVELDEEGNVKEGGVSNTSMISMESIPEKDSRDLFVGLKKGDVLEINPAQLSTSKADLNGILGITPGTNPEYGDKFRCTVEKVTYLKPAELNDEFFAAAFPDGSVTSVSQLEEKIRADFGAYFEGQSDRKFYIDVQKYLLENIKVEMPDNFLKRWMKSMKEKEEDKAHIDDNFNAYLSGFKLKLIEDRLKFEYGLKVEDSLVRSIARQDILSRLASMGMMQFPDAEVENFVTNTLSKKETYQQVVEQAMEHLMLSLFKEKVKMNKKDITPEEFVKLAQN